MTDPPSYTTTEEIIISNMWLMINAEELTGGHYNPVDEVPIERKVEVDVNSESFLIRVRQFMMLLHFQM